MAIPSKQIGWSTTDNLLWQISKQLEQLIKVTSNNSSPTTTTTTTVASLIQYAITPASSSTLQNACSFISNIASPTTVYAVESDPISVTRFYTDPAGQNVFFGDGNNYAYGFFLSSAPGMYYATMIGSSGDVSTEATTACI